MVILEETVMKFTIALATTGQPLIYTVPEDVSEAGSLLPGRGLELTQRHHEYELPGTAWLPQEMLVAAFCINIAAPIGWDDLCFRPLFILAIMSFTIQLVKNRVPVTGQDLVYSGSGRKCGEPRSSRGIFSRDSSRRCSCSFNFSSSFHSSKTSQTAERNKRTSTF